MKKLMVMMAVGMMAIASQAALCAWQYKCTSNVTGMDGADVYILLGAPAASFDSVQAISTAAIQGPVATTTKTKPTFSNGATSTADSDKLTTTSAKSMYIVLVNGDESGYWVSEAKDGSALVYTEGSAPGTLSFQPSSVAFTSFGGSGDVPEPTSAMLLLLGVAGLALRRKQA